MSAKFGFCELSHLLAVCRNRLTALLDCRWLEWLTSLPHQCHSRHWGSERTNNRQGEHLCCAWNCEHHRSLQALRCFCMTWSCISALSKPGLAGIGTVRNIRRGCLKSWAISTFRDLLTQIRQEHGLSGVGLAGTTRRQMLCWETWEVLSSRASCQNLTPAPLTWVPKPCGELIQPTSKHRCPLFVSHSYCLLQWHSPRAEKRNP